MTVRGTARCSSMVALGLLVAAGATSGEDDGEKPAAASARVPWTSSRFVGAPDPPLPYASEPAFPKLKFDHPVLITAAKGTDRLFVGELRGRVYSFPNDPMTDQPDLALDLAKHRLEMTQLYGLEFHPKFDENRYVYLCYVLKEGLPEGTRVSRFEASRDDPPRIDPSSEKVIITWLSGGHNGGCLAFGPDGCLYISTGDAGPASPPDPLNTGQNVSDLPSSILRIDVDHPEKGRDYRIPLDNPLVDVPGARGEIWAYGFRNPWRMSFDRVSGDLWVGDVGWELWELVDRVERGGNYGWSVVEGRQPVHPDGRRGPTPILPPTVVHPHSEAASITGGYVYHGKRLPDLEGVYVYGDYQSGKVWGLRHDGKQVVWHEPLADTPLSLVSFGEDNRGELFLLDHERSQRVYRLAPNPAAKANSEFPRTLSATGLFSSTREHTPAAGVVPYEINASLWSDHAMGQRLLALPGTSRIERDDQGTWLFPEGAVVARTVSLERERGTRASQTRVETQVLHREDESWRPYTYLWNDEQTDATLVDSGGTSRTFAIRDPHAPGGTRTRNYRVHSRAECTLCHNPWVEKRTAGFGRQSASPNGLTTAELNREVVRDGRPVNQLAEFERLGLFARPHGSSPDALPRMADPYDASADLERRARAYLRINCSHCHQFNAGGAATVWLTDELPLEKMQAVGVKPSQGSFGISDARIIAPGDPEGSVLLYRVAKLGGGRMPRVGSSVVDEKGVALLREWISRMPAHGNAPAPRSPGEVAALALLERHEIAPPEARRQAVEMLTATTRGAAALLSEIDRGTIPEPVRGEVAAHAARDPKAEVRDLFERFIPESERVERLGESIDPKQILALAGDAKRGKEIFLNDPSAQCKTCHRLEGAGEPLGPDLSKIGAKYTRPELLGHIIEPSRFIDPKYPTYVIETKSGQVLSGLLAERTASEVSLKDARNQTIRIPSADIERIEMQARSLMPELLLRDLTAQQAADLLEFLATLK